MHWSEIRVPCYEMRVNKMPIVRLVIKCTGSNVSRRLLHSVNGNTVETACANMTAISISVYDIGPRRCAGLTSTVRCYYFI